MPRLNPKTCNRCGKKITWDAWIHSKPTNNYYCRDFEACDKRAKVKKEASA